MTDKLTVEDVQAEQAERDSEGELIPNTKEVKWNGSVKEVEVLPMTTGIVNEIAEYESGLAVLDPEAVANVVNVCCAGLELTADDVDALPVEQVDNLVTPITEELPEVDPGGNL